MNLISDAFKMIGDIRRSNRTVDVWGAALNVPQVLGGLWFINRIEGLVILLMVLFTLIIAGQIHRRARFSRLIGLCHIPWLIMVPWLLSRIDFAALPALFPTWLTYVTLTIIISLFFDVYDVIKYLKGDRTYAWGRT